MAGGRRVLSLNLVEEMQRRQTGAAAEEYGLGWKRIRFSGDGPAQAFGHGGAYGTQLFIDKERGLAAAIFTQMPSGQSSKLIEAVQARLQEIF
jgi:CubicO group peptidase (beta-lactamase class C family)